MWLKISAVLHFFKQLLGVWKLDETLFFMFEEVFHKRNFIFCLLGKEVCKQCHKEKGQKIVNNIG